MRSPIPPKRKPEPPNGIESFYGPRELWRRVREIAAEEGRSKSNLAVWVFERWLTEYDATKAKKKR